MSIKMWISPFHLPIEISNKKDKNKTNAQTTNARSKDKEIAINARKLRTWLWFKHRI